VRAGVLGHDGTPTQRNMHYTRTTGAAVRFGPCVNKAVMVRPHEMAPGGFGSILPTELG
jgi:hypothetical protein